MTIYNKTTARNVARELIATSLQSGSIKLLGTHTVAAAQLTSDADALYLSNLLIKLTEKISNNEA